MNPSNARFPATVGLLLALGTATATAQGKPYAFAEREPRTVLEQQIEERLPSLVKVHGASGLRTIIPYAAGVIVSEEGHVLTLDLVMIQRDQTRVVLADGSRFPAYSFGAQAPISGELVFSTGMVGYAESLTDPSYRGQV